MRTRARGVISVLVVAAVGAMATGCNNTTLDSGSQALVVKYVPSPSGSGRYDRAEFSFVTVRILPADPETAKIYGQNPMSLRFDPFTADLTQAEAVTFSNIALAAGSYVVTRIDIGSPTLVDTNISPTPATCIEGIAALPSGPAAGQVPSTFIFPNPPSYPAPPGLAFTVRPGQSKLSLTVNVPGVITGFENAFTCNPSCNGGPPCLTAFDQASYRSALLASLSIQ